MKMTEAELLEAVHAALSEVDTGHDDALTTREWQEALGLGSAATRDRIRTLIRAGKMEPVKVVRTSELTDVARPVQAYRLKAS